MPPLGRWLRPAIAAGVTAAITLGSWFAKTYAQGDIKRLADKYPALAATESVKDIIGGLPIVGGLFSFFSGPIADKVGETGMTDEDKKALEQDHAIVTWAPVLGTVVLVIGGLLTFYFLWTDVIRGPTATQALGTAGLAASVPLAVAPTPAAQAVAPVLASASAPATVAVAPLPVAAPLEVHA